MNNISIKFMHHPQRSYSSRQSDINKNRSAFIHSSKSFYDMDHIGQQNNVETLTQRRGSQLSESNSFSKGKKLQMYQNQLQKNELRYRSIITSLQQQSINHHSISKKQPQFSDKKERSLIIHSRNHPRCTFWKKKLSSNAQLQAKQKQTRSNSTRFTRSKNPQYGLQMPKAKKMSLTPKNSGVINKGENKQQLNLLFKKNQASSPKGKYWATIYRPWSPQKKYVMDADQLGSIDKFIQINL